jgi:hypothetical protein
MELVFMSCNKVSYASIMDAKIVIQQMRRSGKLKSKYLGGKSRVYMCPICEYYHLTTMPLSEVKRKSKNIKEQKRRLRVITEIQKSRSINTVLQLQEWWMLLIMKDDKFILECKIFGKEHSVKHLK